MAVEEQSRIILHKKTFYLAMSGQRHFQIAEFPRYWTLLLKCQMKSDKTQDCDLNSDGTSRKTKACCSMGKPKVLTYVFHYFLCYFLVWVHFNRIGLLLIMNFSILYTFFYIHMCSTHKMSWDACLIQQKFIHLFVCLWKIYTTVKTTSSFK